MANCPYCGTELEYADIDANFDNITEEWWCPNCKEVVEVDEPGLRYTDNDDEWAELYDN